MGPPSHPTAQEGLLSRRRRNDVFAERPVAKIANLYDDDPLAAAKGTVNGTLWGAVVWAVILWVLL